MKYVILKKTLKPKFFILEKAQVRVKPHMTKTKHGKIVSVIGYIREGQEATERPILSKELYGEKDADKIMREQEVRSWGVKEGQATYEPVDFSKDERFHAIAYKEPTPKALNKLKEWFKKNPNATIKMYHGTNAEHAIETEGLKPTTLRTAHSLQSRHGVVSLSIYPGQAWEFGRMAYPGKKINVYAVNVPVNRLIPDTDQLKNKRYWGENKDIGGTLADSLAYGHGAQVRGAIPKEWITREETMEKAFVKPHMTKTKQGRIVPVKGFERKQERIKQWTAAFEAGVKELVDEHERADYGDDKRFWAGEHHLAASALDNWRRGEYEAAHKQIKSMEPESRDFVPAGIRNYLKGRIEKCLISLDNLERLNKAHVRPYVRDGHMVQGFDRKDVPKGEWWEDTFKRKPTMGTPVVFTMIKNKIDGILSYVKKIAGNMTARQKGQVEKRLAAVKPHMAKFNFTPEQKRYVKARLVEIKKEVARREVKKFLVSASEKFLSQVPGLTGEEYHGLKKMGYTEGRIRKMGVDAAKASFWNRIESEKWGGGINALTQQLNDILSKSAYLCPFDGKAAVQLRRYYQAPYFIREFRCRDGHIFQVMG